MNPWLETTGVVMLGAAGAIAGRGFSRLAKPYWTLGYLGPFTVIVLLGVAYRIRPLEFVPPFCWLMAGRTEYALIAFIGTMVLTTPLSRLPLRRDRIAVIILMVVVVFQVSAWPFLAPAFNQKRLAALRTRIDSDGICLQNTDYTCGPAAAVTALRRLGFEADEGVIAAWCHTSAAMGTPPDVLSGVLQKHYGAAGLDCEYRPFGSVSELKQTCPTLALVKFAFLLDHYVTVLDVTDEFITVGDPLTGRQTFSHDEFAKEWRFVGVTLNRAGTTAVNRGSSR